MKSAGDGVPLTCLNRLESRLFSCICPKWSAVTAIQYRMVSVIDVEFC